MLCPLTIHYEMYEGRPYPSAYGGSWRPGFEKSKYSLADSELPNLQEVLDTTLFPFKRGFVQLAFGFFELERTTLSLALKFLVLMISLEVLFNPGEPRISHTVGSNVSNLLGENQQRRKEIYSELREFYKKRSSIVHQGVYDYSSYLTSVAPDFDKVKIPERFKSWWGPKGFTAPFAKIDLRVCGKYLYCMRSPDGKDYWGTGVYREIVQLQRIVATDSFADEKGNVVPATHYGMSADLPLEFLVTVTFEDYQGKTRLTLAHKGFPPGRDSEMASEGWNQSFDKLAETLK